MNIYEKEKRRIINAANTKIEQLKIQIELLVSVLTLQDADVDIEKCLTLADAAMRAENKMLKRHCGKLETGAFNSIADIMELKRKLDDAGLVRQHKNDEIDKLKAGIEIGKSLIDERDEIIAGYVAELNSIRDKIAPTNISYLMEMVEHQKNTINRMKEKNAELSNDRKIYINKSNKAITDVRRLETELVENENAFQQLFREHGSLMVKHDVLIGQRVTLEKCIERMTTAFQIFVSQWITIPKPDFNLRTVEVDDDGFPPYDPDLSQPTF